jgi:hypothetical protein
MKLKKPIVFISYSSKDEEAASEIAKFFGRLNASIPK